MSEEQPTKFEGFEPANTTPVPDVLFDELLTELSGTEIKVILYIIRRTLGFKKVEDGISLSQFTDGITTRDGKVLDKGCGIKKRSTVSKTLRDLIGRGYVEAIKKKTNDGDSAVTVYRVRFKGVVAKSALPSAKKSTTLVPKSPLPGSAQTATTGSADLATHNKQLTTNSNVQETEEQEENAHVSDDNAPTPSLSESNSPSSLQSIPPEEKAPAQSDEQSSKQESAVSDSQKPDVPPAQDTGKTSSGRGKKTTNTRTRRTKKTEFVVPEELLPRVDAFYGFIDTWIQGKMGDPDEGYEHTPEGNAAICDLLTCKKPPTHNRFKKMLDEMWDEPKNAKTGWHTRAHMGEVPFLCKEYKSRRLAVAATERKETSTKSTLETATALAASAGYRNQIWDDDDDDLEYLTPVSKKQGA